MNNALVQVPAPVEHTLLKVKKDDVSTKPGTAIAPIVKAATPVQPPAPIKPTPGSVQPSEKPAAQVPKVAVPVNAPVDTSHKTIQGHTTVEGPQTDPSTGPAYTPKDDFTIFIPNIFTANNDGVNDKLVIVADEHSKAEVHIVSAITGNLVFHSNDLNNMWDGLLPNGNIAPEGQYVCVVMFTDMEGHLHRGRMAVQLYR